ncbi:MAG: redoxin domain-containing protein [Roseburia sp.]|nr:redoxin domain-containing protein [Roseburia sp.]
MIKRILSSLLVYVTLAACVNDKEADEPVWSLREGDPLPEFTVTMNDGTVWTTRDLWGYESVIVFFNTECADCRRELPAIQLEYYESVRRGIPYLLISREEDPEHIATYWKNHGLTMPYSAQRDRRIYNLFANSGIPRIYRADFRCIIYSVETSIKK